MQNDPPSQLEERLQGQVPGGCHQNGRQRTLPPAPHTRPRRLKTTMGDEEPFAMVVLPNKPSGRHSKPLPPPGGARRVNNNNNGSKSVGSSPPVPPPRPEHTLSPRSRPIVPAKLDPLLSSSSSEVTGHNPGGLGGNTTVVGTEIRTTTTHSSLSGGIASQHHSGGSRIMELVSLPNRNVSLTAPRAESDREKNLYTEAPQKVLPQHQQTPLLSVIQNQPVHSSSSPAAITAAATLKKVAGTGGLHGLRISELDDLVILSEPSKSVSSSPLSSESIFCQSCGKCKCEACCRPRKLPQKWLCQGTFLCSKNTVVDTLSCMCCVKGLIYHCTKDMEDDELCEASISVSDSEIRGGAISSSDPEDIADQPCSCQGPHVKAKWAVMAMLLPVLPCLLTYPLLGACAQCTEHVYAKVTASGCQCQKAIPASNNATTISTHAAVSAAASVVVSSNNNNESLSRPMLCSSTTVSTALSSKSP